MNKNKFAQLNIFCVFFFCLLVHRLAVRISLLCCILYKLLLYSSRSTTGRSGTTQRLWNCWNILYNVVLTQIKEKSPNGLAVNKQSGDWVDTCKTRAFQHLVSRWSRLMISVPKAVFTQYWIACAKNHTRWGFCLHIRKLILAQFCNGEKLPRRSRKCSVKYRIGSVLACSRRSDSWARAKNWREKKNEERPREGRGGYCSHPRENELRSFSLVSPQSPLLFPLRFPRMRFSSLPTIGSPRSTIWTPRTGWHCAKLWYSVNS